MPILNILLAQEGTSEFYGSTSKLMDVSYAFYHESARISFAYQLSLQKLEKICI